MHDSRHGPYPSAGLPASYWELRQLLPRLHEVAREVLHTGADSVALSVRSIDDGVADPYDGAVTAALFLHRLQVLFAHGTLEHGAVWSPRALAAELELMSPMITRLLDELLARGDTATARFLVDEVGRDYAALAQDLNVMLVVEDAEWTRRADGPVESPIWDRLRRMIGRDVDDDGRA